MISKNLLECANYARENEVVTPALIDALIESGYPNIANYHFTKNCDGGPCPHDCVCIAAVLREDEDWLDFGERHCGESLLKMSKTEGLT